MFGLGGWEIGLLVIFGLLFFGPKKLPQLMRQAGKIMGEVKKASNEFQFSIERELDDDQYRRQHRREKKLAKLKAEQEAGGEQAAPAPETVAAGPDSATPPVGTESNGTNGSNGNGSGSNGNGGVVNGANGADTVAAAADADSQKPKS